jgi:hypothetical protein
MHPKTLVLGVLSKGWWCKKCTLLQRNCFKTVTDSAWPTVLFGGVLKLFVGVWG